MAMSFMEANNKSRKLFLFVKWRKIVYDPTPLGCFNGQGFDTYSLLRENENRVPCSRNLDKKDLGLWDWETSSSYKRRNPVCFEKPFVSRLI